MNNIGVGIFCFGDDFYFKGAIDKIAELKRIGLSIYILTDKPEEFPDYVDIVQHSREFKSYHDKLILPKFILSDHDICILIDADLHIKDYGIFNELKTYKFKKGISYVDVLTNHPSNKKYVKEFGLNQVEWSSYSLYAKSLYPDFDNLELIWEYFLIINKEGFNDDFYCHYEKLQIAKEFSDLTLNKEVSGPGEGISISVSSKLTNINLERDLELYEKIKDNFISISRKFTHPDFWPEWMK
jgi:hypothetical protein